MLIPAIPANEAARLAALGAYEVLDTEPEPAFDALTELAAHVLQVPVALVSLVDGQRQWFKARYGLEATETPRDVSFCGHVVAGERLLIVEDATTDPRFADNPLVTGDPFVRFYVGVPLRTDDGFVLGTLCGLDHQARQVDARSLALLEKLALQTMAQLELRRTVRLGVEQEARLREALQRVERSNADLLAILELLQVGVAFLDERRRLLFANDRFQALLGLDPETVTGLSCAGLLALAPSYLKHLEPLLDVSAEQRGRLPMIVDYPSRRRRHLEIEVRDDPRAADRRVLLVYDVTEVTTLRATTNQLTPRGLIGAGPAMAEVFRAIRDIAKGDWATLIEGETGTGKELVARAIHAASPRSAGRFVAVNCGGLNEALLSSQLFGHKRGSFTGAVADQEGLFEAAHGGTLLLDEVGEMPLPIQAHLLRVLQEKEIVRVGETRPRKVDVRILAATNRKLDAEVAAGRFRGDLLYRLRVARISVPALRERPEDILPLAESFLAEARVASGKAIRDLAPDVLRALAAYAWPGNVRELKAAIEHAVIRCHGNVIGSQDLPVELRRPPPSESSPAPGAPAPSALVGNVPVQALLDSDERARLIEALRATRGNRQAAAALLGVSRATFYRRLAALGLDVGNKG